MGLAGRLGPLGSGATGTAPPQAEVLEVLCRRLYKVARHVRFSSPLFINYCGVEGMHESVRRRSAPSGMTHDAKR